MVFWSNNKIRDNNAHEIRMMCILFLLYYTRHFGQLWAQTDYNDTNVMVLSNDEIFFEFHHDKKVKK